jgi:ornithine cyclodeaminase
VRAWDPSPGNLQALGRAVAELGLAFEPQPGPREAVAQADIVITVTPSQKPLVEHGWVKPGTHICAMGADTKGKQELATALVAAAAVFADEPAQAISIGECQHAFAAGLIRMEDLRGTLGAVIAGLCDGRRSDDEITLFDGTGVALQDLAVAELAVRNAAMRGKGVTVEY